MIARRLLRRLLPQRVALRLRREWLARQVASGQGPQFEDDIPLLKTFVKPTDVCWDIGANAGTYTLHLSRLAAHVFAIEPVPHSFDILRDVTARAHLTNVVARSLALSDKVGRAKMALPVDGFYGGFYMSSEMPCDATVSRSFDSPSTDHASSIFADGRPLQMLFTPKAAQARRIASE